MGALVKGGFEIIKFILSGVNNTNKNNIILKYVRNIVKLNFTDNGNKSKPLDWEATLSHVSDYNGLLVWNNAEKAQNCLKVINFKIFLETKLRINVNN